MKNKGDVPPFIDRRFVAVARGAKHGASIREKRTIGDLQYKQPKDLHLIYIGVDDDAQLVVRHMRKFGVDYTNIDGEEEKLVKAAQGEDEPRDYQYAKDFAIIEFQRSSYFTLVVDAPGWDFYYPYPDEEEPIKDELHDPLVFIERKRKNGPIKHENWSFFNAKPVTPAGCNGVRCMNFFTDKNGRLLRIVEEYSFEIYLRVPFSQRSIYGHHITIIIDPDGQNQGP